MEELAGLLSRERLLLERLLFKLVTLRHLLNAGDVRFLPWASEEVDRSTVKVGEAALYRSLAAEALVPALQPTEATAGITLRIIAESSPEPWRTIFAEHRCALIELGRDIDDARTASQRLAGSGAAAVTATLDRLTGSAQAETDVGSDPAGRTPYGPAPTQINLATG